MKSRRVRLSELKRHPGYFRRRGDRVSRTLIESVRKHGVLMPLIVTPGMEVIDGIHRWAAQRICGRKTVRVVVIRGC